MLCSGSNLPVAEQLFSNFCRPARAIMSSSSPRRRPSCSLTPAGPPCRAIALHRASARRHGRPRMEPGRLPRRYFEALSHGIYTRCLRFAARVTPGPRKTRFRAVASLLRVNGAKLTSTGIRYEVSLSSWHPPHPGLSWRTPSGSWNAFCVTIAPLGRSMGALQMHWVPCGDAPPRRAGTVDGVNEVYLVA